MPLFFYFIYYCVNLLYRYLFNALFGDCPPSKPLLRIIHIFSAISLVNESPHYQTLASLC